VLIRIKGNKIGVSQILYASLITNLVFFISFVIINYLLMLHIQDYVKFAAEFSTHCLEDMRMHVDNFAYMI